MKKFKHILIWVIIITCIIGFSILLFNNFREDKGTFYELELGKIYKDRIFDNLYITDNLTEGEMNLSQKYEQETGCLAYVGSDAKSKSTALLNYLDTVDFTEIKESLIESTPNVLEITLITSDETGLLNIQIHSESIVCIYSMDTSKSKYYKIYDNSFNLNDVYNILKKLVNKAAIPAGVAATAGPKNPHTVAVTPVSEFKFDKSVDWECFES